MAEGDTSGAVARMDFEVAILEQLVRERQALSPHGLCGVENCGQCARKAELNRLLSIESVLPRLQRDDIMSLAHEWLMSGPRQITCLEASQKLGDLAKSNAFVRAALVRTLHEARTALEQAHARHRQVAAAARALLGKLVQLGLETERKELEALL